MKANISNRVVLPEIPSASGIELVNNRFYIIGDNSPYLFELNFNFKLTGKIQILQTFPIEEVIPKMSKPDFEAMTIVHHQSDFELYIFGSGALTPQRDILVKVSLNDKKVQQFSLIEFYDQLLRPKVNELNIEAAVATLDFLFLFNRSDNSIFKIAWNDFEDYLQDTCRHVQISHFRIILKSEGPTMIGFSGATLVSENRVIFSASAEKTTNAIDDGEIVGSYLGFFDLAELKDNLELQLTRVLLNDTLLPLKVESVCCCQESADILNLILITDSDGGTSELLECEFQY